MSRTPTRDAAASFPQLVLLVEGRRLELAVSLLVVAAALAYMFLSRRRKTFGGIPGEPGWPIINDDIVYLFKKGTRHRVAELASRRRKMYGDVYCHRMLGEVVVTVGTLEMARAVFAGEGDFVSGGWPASTVKMLGNTSVATLTGKEHLRLRKMVAPLFTPDAIRGYLPGIVRLVEGRLASWAASEGPVPAFTEAKTLTLDLLMELVMGCTVEESMRGVYDGDAMEVWHEWEDALFSMPINLPGTAYYRGLKARQLLVKAADRVLARMKDDANVSNGDAGAAAGAAHNGEQAPKKHTGKFMTMGHMLVEARDDDGQPLTMQQMQDMCITFMFAGHDTTTSSMALLLQQLAAAPAVLAKLRAEQAAVVEEHGEAYTEAALKAMVYAEATIRETLRIAPIVGAVSRHALKDFQIGGYTIRKGTRVWVNLCLALDDPQWSDLNATDPLAPGVFNPDRWLGEASTRLGWIAFGSGPRMCIGWPLAVAELKVFLAVLARKYSWELLNYTGEEWTYFPLPRPADASMPVRLTPLTPAA